MKSMVKNKRNISVLLSTILFINSPSIHAAANALTIHSRANCLGINESISWDGTKRWMLFTIGHHMVSNSKESHKIETGWEQTWRSAAIHWSEANYKSYHVVGEHYLKNNDGVVMLLGKEYVTDCSIYNGWWDYKY